jgi:2-oxoglutarate ferredoxin oxidoreductase subunit alpha
MTSLVVGDGILGQMMEPVVFRDYKKPQLPAKDWALTGREGRNQNIVRSLWLKEGALEDLNYKLQRKYRQIEQNETRCEQYQTEDAEIIVVAYGVAARIARAAVEKARQEGTKAGLIRPITLWPFPSEAINKAGDGCNIFLTVEMSNGQMVDDVKLSLTGKTPVAFYGRPGGGVPSVEEVFKRIQDLRVRSTTKV